MDRVRTLPAEVGSSREGPLKKGAFVIFNNTKGWVDPALNWLVGQVWSESTSQSESFSVWLWGTSS